MALDKTPWFVGGGAQHSPEVARGLAFASTNGAEGVAGVGDLKVTAQGTPNGTVQVRPGAGLLLNRYPGGTGQTYSLRNATATPVPITATASSGGRTDVVIARVLDPQYEGSAPPDPTNFDYSRLEVIQGVPSGTKYTQDLGLAYPAIILAKITLPASTATVTNAMITDLRQVAQPRRDRAMRAVFPPVKIAVPTAGYSSWPISSAQRPLIRVPSWATNLDIVAHISGALYTKGSAADFVAGIRTGFGTTLPAENGIIIQDAEDTGGRYHYSLVGNHKIPAEMRGTDQYLNLQAVRTAGTGNLYADYQTSVIIDWEFSEVAE